VIILTSNAEHEQIADIVRNISDPAERANKIKDALRSVFKPEQRARIDEIYAFGDLSSEAIARVIGKFLVAFAKQVGVELVEVDAALLVQMIAQREKLKKYGVREVIRLIEKTVMDGMLDARAQGAKRVRIVVDGPAVQVLPAA
jgi:ATP-dependent Clp protease ATP-binding subunit ClpA